MSIRKMKQLEKIDLKNCGFAKIPEVICGMKTINKTDAKGNSYKECVPVLMMENLRAVNLTGNNIGRIKANVVDMLEKNEKLHIWLDVEITSNVKKIAMIIKSKPRMIAILMKVKLRKIVILRQAKLRKITILMKAIANISILIWPI
ncbi:hypothetical protein CWI40_010070 [Ordospora colligata]|nr:hypothetical protein CWI40_010070 [Ordospora colligata]